MTEYFIIEYDKVCRTCLSEGEIYYLFDESNTEVCLVEKLRACTFLSFEENDGLPLNICVKCIDKIENAYLFLQKCNETDKILRDYYNIPKKIIKNKTKHITQDVILSNEDNNLNSDVFEQINLKIEDNDIHNDSNHCAEENLDESVSNIDQIENIDENITYFNVLKKEIKENEAKHITEEVILNNENIKINSDVFEQINPKIEPNDFHYETNHFVVENLNQPVLNFEEIYVTEEVILSNEGNNVNIEIDEIKSEIIEIQDELINKTDKIIETKLNNKKSVKAKSMKPKTYECKACLEKFTSYILLKEHFKIVQHKKNERPKRACPICNKLMNPKSLPEHMHIHSKEKPYCCEYCGRQFSVKVNLIRHQRIHTGKKPYICNICDKSFSQSSTLIGHRRLHTGEKSFICTVCGKSFVQASGLKCHTKTHEKDILGEYECEVCAQKFSTRRLVGQHRQHTHIGFNFVCTKCDRRFNNEDELKTHMKHHPKPRPFLSMICDSDGDEKIQELYQCEICKKSFLRKWILRSHMLIHGEKKFLCSNCGRRFTTKQALQSHLNVHMEQKPYSCTICGKTFCHTRALKPHMRIHTGEKPYVCKICNRAFTQWTSLNYHMRTHNKERS